MSKSRQFTPWSQANAETLLDSYAERIREIMGIEPERKPTPEPALPAPIEQPAPPPQQTVEKRQIISFGPYNWRVLDVQGGKALLITENVIEKNRPYHNKYVDITWENCTLRKYLNGEFLDRFSKYDQGRILEVNNENKDNQWYKTDGGAPTRDKIFCLSIEECVKYFGDSGQLKNSSRRDAGEMFDEFNGNRMAKDGNKESSAWWWLRSPGRYSTNAAYVYRDGSLSVRGRSVDSASEFGGVRPALWLNLG